MNKYAPEPNSCRVCGVSERYHTIEWSEEEGYHSYLAPDNALRLERMRGKS